MPGGEQRVWIDMQLAQFEPDVGKRKEKIDAVRRKYKGDKRAEKYLVDEDLLYGTERYLSENWGYSQAYLETAAYEKTEEYEKMKEEREEKRRKSETEIYKSTLIQSIVG